MSNKKDILNAGTIDLSHVPEQRLEEINEGYRLLGLSQQGFYPGIDEFSRQLQKISGLKYEPFEYTTSSNTFPSNPKIK